MDAGIDHMLLMRSYVMYLMETTKLLKVICILGVQFTLQ